ncbi:unnamed protein product [Adineta ricciae]|uniref:Uncharacterized protein n=1 Tax=Adineta ricciae TaxID=249248 RepID=A0A815GVX7_ADIRI|nr:unnamed protein product [Adineta ricciae]CAF1431920.1 unnamed protein product [Adineta ricciae]
MFQSASRSTIVTSKQPAVELTPVLPNTCRMTMVGYRNGILETSRSLHTGDESSLQEVLAADLNNDTLRTTQQRLLSAI